MTNYPSISHADLIAARKRIDPFIHRTPVLTCSALDAASGAKLFFKCENFQKVGAFKMRGAANAVAQLSAEQAAHGVATHSSGNHGQALALAARLAGVDCHVVMPRNAPAVKKAAVAGYGARVIECEPGQAARQQSLAEVIEQTGAHVVPPFDDARIIIGQASCALELLEQVDDLDIVIAPVGGGGLLAGTALAVSHVRPDCAVWAGEPAAVDDTARSLAAGRILPNDSAQSIADGLLTTVGELPFAIIQHHVERVITVSEEEIVAAMREIWLRMKIIIEPSCAVAFAALLKEPEDVAGKRVGVILTGGNVDLANLPFS